MISFFESVLNVNGHTGVLPKPRLETPQIPSYYPDNLLDTIAIMEQFLHYLPGIVRVGAGVAEVDSHSCRENQLIPHSILIIR